MVSGVNLPVAVLELVGGKFHLYMYYINWLRQKEIYPNKTITDVVMFGWALNLQLGGEVMKIHYPKLTVMHGVENSVSLFFNDISNVLSINQMITDHKEIDNLFGPGIYHKTHSVFKSNPFKCYNRNIGLFSGNDYRIDGYFVGVHRYLRMRKPLLSTVLSAEFNIIIFNLKPDKLV